MLESYTMTTLLALKGKNQSFKKKFGGTLCLNSAVLCHFAYKGTSAVFKPDDRPLLVFVAWTRSLPSLQMSLCIILEKKRRSAVSRTTVDGNFWDREKV